MTGKRFILNFIEDKAFLTPETCLTFEQIGLPDVVTRFNEPALWTFEVLEYNSEDQSILAEITSYLLGNIEFPAQQLAYADVLEGIQKIIFRDIDTNALLQLIDEYEPEVLPSGPDYELDQLIEDVLASKETSKPMGKPTDKTPKIKVQEIKTSFTVPIKDLKFKFGCVSLSRKIEKINRVCEFSIYNDELREEFDAVKNYFGNVLKVKKVQVNIHLRLENGVIVKSEAHSPEISRINKSLIESVKFEFVKEASKKKLQIEIDKSLFTMDEFFDNITENKVRSKTFYSNEEDLFDDILQISDTKHYKHLRYLSSRHAHTVMKLRFVLKPTFSFIFLIEGERQYHIIWETLDSQEATYIWHVEPKDKALLRVTLRKIEDIINTIKVQGKTAYIQSSEDSYRRIRHDYSDLVEGFVKWKGEIESYLI
jgi:hypothetical protein